MRMCTMASVETFDTSIPHFVILVVFDLSVFWLKKYICNNFMLRFIEEEKTL